MEGRLSHSAVVACPRNMVGRVIGKGGETIKALQQFTKAVIQIDQSQDPTRVTIAGEVDSLKLAVSMIQDIVHSKFKGFAMLRQMGQKLDREPLSSAQVASSRPVYVEGYGFVPPSQFSEADDPQNLRTLAPLNPQQACLLQDKDDPISAATLSSQLPLDTAEKFSPAENCSGAGSTLQDYKQMLEILSLYHQQQQPSSSPYLSQHSSANPVPSMGHHLPAGMLGGASQDTIPSLRSPSSASLYNCSLNDSPNTPTQVLNAGLALSGDESYGSPPSSSFNSSPSASFSQLASATAASYPLQGFSLPAKSAPVAHSLFANPGLSTGISASRPMDLLGPIAKAPLSDARSTDTSAPGGWITIPDPEGRHFYYNPLTQQSQWDLCY